MKGLIKCICFIALFSFCNSKPDISGKWNLCYIDDISDTTSIGYVAYLAFAKDIANSTITFNENMLILSDSGGIVLEEVKYLIDGNSKIYIYKHDTISSSGSIELIKKDSMVFTIDKYRYYLNKNSNPKI
jgi:hypothetical protein